MAPREDGGMPSRIENTLGARSKRSLSELRHHPPRHWELKLWVVPAAVVQEAAEVTAPVVPEAAEVVPWGQAECENSPRASSLAPQLQ